ncbi:flocculation protein FLO11-like [Rhagoletis pomonella]|uniref:flocculation protein FLO11-like n=1 Tax=Rhagoletis pomonella TaxID=28610 RepID=UPI00178164BD|nr:flocculation protein FLO11-like [Rhagoletis pomonella]
MWYIFFIGSLAAAASTTELYTPLCNESGSPVCATNGQKYLYFQNECKLNAYIYKQLFFGRIVPIKTDIENCLPNCDEIVCPKLFKPVCAQQVPKATVKTVPNACLVDRLICETKQHWTVIGEGPCSPIQAPKSKSGPEYTFTSDAQRKPAKLVSAPAYDAYADQNDGYSASAPTSETDSVPEDALTSTDIAQLYQGAELVAAPSPSYATAQETTAMSSSNAEQNEGYSLPASLSGKNEAQDQSSASLPYAETAPAAADYSKTEQSPGDSSPTYIVSEKTLQSILASYLGQNQLYVAEDPVSVSYVDPEPSATSQPSSNPVEAPDYASHFSGSVPCTVASPAMDSNAASEKNSTSKSYSPVVQDQVYAAPEPAPVSYVIPEPSPAPQPSSYTVRDQVYASPASYSATYGAPKPSPAQQSSSQYVPDPSPAPKPPTYANQDPVFVLLISPPVPNVAQEPSPVLRPTSYPAQEASPALQPSSYAAQSQTYAVSTSASATNIGQVKNIALQPSSYSDQDQAYAAPASATYATLEPYPVAQPSSYAAPEPSPAPQSSSHADQVYSSPGSTNVAEELSAAPQPSSYAVQDQLYAVPASASVPYSAPEINPQTSPYSDQSQVYAEPGSATCAVPDPQRSSYPAPGPSTAPQPSSAQDQLYATSASASVPYSSLDANPAPQPSSYSDQDQVYAASATHAAPEPCPAPQPSSYAVPEPIPAPQPSSYTAQDEVVPEPSPAPQPSIYAVQDQVYGASVSSTAPQSNPERRPSSYLAQDPGPASATYHADQSPSPGSYSHVVSAASSYETSEAVPSPYINPVLSSYEAPSSAPVADPAAASGLYAATDTAADVYGSKLNSSPAPAATGYPSASASYAAPEPIPALQTASYSARNQIYGTPASATYPTDQGPTPASFSYAVPTSSSLYQAPEPAPGSAVASPAYSSSNQNAETVPSSYSKPLPSSYDGINSAQITQTALVPASYAATETAYQSQSSVSVTNSYGAPTPDVAGYPVAKARSGQPPAHYSAPPIAPGPTFPPWLNSKTNALAEFAAATNIAKFVHGLRWPFGPIYYQPNYVHIIHYDD